MNEVKVIEDNGPYVHHRPFRAAVNGNVLCDKRGRQRRFADSFAAAIAGAKEVDRIRASSMKTKGEQA